MLKTFAVIKNNIVSNILEIDMDTQLDFYNAYSQSHTLCEVPEFLIGKLSIGDIFYDNRFITQINLDEQLSFLKKAFKEQNYLIQSLKDRILLLENTIFNNK